MKLDTNTVFVEVKPVDKVVKAAIGSPLAVRIEIYSRWQRQLHADNSQQHSHRNRVAPMRRSALDGKEGVLATLFSSNKKRCTTENR
jgi:hypothetical protein